MAYCGEGEKWFLLHCSFISAVHKLLSRLTFDLKKTSLKSILSVYEIEQKSNAYKTDNTIIHVLTGFKLNYRCKPPLFNANKIGVYTIIVQYGLYAERHYTL